MNITQPLVRPACRNDLTDIVRLLSNDPLGRERETFETPPPSVYFQAFDRIQNDVANTLFVAELDGKVVGCLQLTIIPGLSFSGMRRALIEDVRVDESCRGKGIGHRLMENAIHASRAKGCGMTQLLVHETRHEAHRFYADFGFSQRHLGMRLLIEPTD